MQKTFKSKLAEVRFYFPEEKNLKLISKKVLEMVTDDKMNNYLGFLTDEYFLADITPKLGKNKGKIGVLKEKDINLIKDTIFDFSKKFNKVLKLKNGAVRYFVFPWLPSEKQSKDMGGIAAYAVYYGVVHLYIDLKKFNKKSLLETLAHELNHIKFFELQQDLYFTVQQHLVTEGLAEYFREDIVGGKVAPWSKAFNESRILKEIKRIEPILLSKDRKDYSELFYGGKRFKRWTGYTVGYFLVKKFLKKYKGMSWEKIMKTDVKKFFE